jgi:hypothetical protein
MFCSTIDFRDTCGLHNDRDVSSHLPKTESGVCALLPQRSMCAAASLRLALSCAAQLIGQWSEIPSSGGAFLVSPPPPLRFSHTERDETRLMTIIHLVP